jgi:lipoyl(octanoyl) transferase
VAESEILGPVLSRPAFPTQHRSTATAFIFSKPVPYAVAWELQSTLHSERIRNLRPDTVLIMEHQPVYTMGRGTHPSHWGGNEDLLRASGADLHHVNRGGSVTYHGPGQTLLYPIFKLAHHAAGPKQLVWLLEEVIIRLLKRWEIDGNRIEKKPGVWVMTPTPLKIASIGIRVEHGVTLHGFALNVDMDLMPFHLIHPCGFAGSLMTSMARQLNRPLVLTDVTQDLAQIFAAVFALDWLPAIDHPDTVLKILEVPTRRDRSIL